MVYYILTRGLVWLTLHGLQPGIARYARGNARIMPWPVLYSALQCSTGENGARCRSLTCTHTSAPVEEVEEKVYEVQDAQKNLEEEEEKEGSITFMLGSLPRMTL